MHKASREVWCKRVERWQESGLTSKEFAAEMGINARTLTYWKWRLGKEAHAAETAKSSPSTHGKPGPMKPTFVELRPPPSPVLSTPPLEVAIGQGVVVRVPVGFDAETLVRVVTVLGART